MGSCARSRGSALACTVGVSGFILHAHRTRGRGTSFVDVERPLSSFPPLFHPLIGTLKPDDGHDCAASHRENERRIPTRVEILVPCRLVRRRVSATLQGKLTTFHDESLLSIETTLRQENHRCRIRTNDSIVSRLPTHSSLSLIESNNQTTIYIYVYNSFSSAIIPISFSPFHCFPVPHHGQLIGVIYKGKPENLGIRNPPGSNKSQVAERDGNGTPLVSWLYCSYYRAMHH